MFPRGVLRSVLLLALIASVHCETATPEAASRGSAATRGGGRGRGWFSKGSPWSWLSGFSGSGSTYGEAEIQGTAPANKRQATFDKRAPKAPKRGFDGNTERVAGLGPIAGGIVNVPNRLQSGDLQLNATGFVDCGQPITYCGGTTDPFTEAVCTPFNVRRPSLDGGGCCTGSCFQQQFQDPNTRSLGGPTGALAWQSPGASDYWVFHGCDGAGLQTDCAGDGYYAEHFVDLCPNGFGPGCDCDVYSTDLHNQCPFTHPGTGATTKFYSCGWWNDGGKWPDYGFDWWKNNGAGLPVNGDSGQSWPDFVILLYPWVCHKDDSRDFSYFGLDKNVNCFCDNEPKQDYPRDPSCVGINPDFCQPPPVWYAYKAWWDGNFRLKLFGGQVGAAVWDTFYLDALQAPPW